MYLSCIHWSFHLPPFQRTRERIPLDSRRACSTSTPHLRPPCSLFSFLISSLPRMFSLGSQVQLPSNHLTKNLVHIRPYLLHVVPVRHDAVLERVPDLQQAPELRRRPLADEHLALERARQHAQGVLVCRRRTGSSTSAGRRRRSPPVWCRCRCRALWARCGGCLSFWRWEDVEGHRRLSGAVWRVLDGVSPERRAIAQS
ncbi:hypothetical protein GE09DRAFT_173456 [Coniochaeta sp. 2T2.1]|nr:hypothetical protein GE09DRAFT_173456 [Coniochaeta sp. 2T2.1]